MERKAGDNSGTFLKIAEDRNELLRAQEGAEMRKASTSGMLGDAAF